MLRLGCSPYGWLVAQFSLIRHSAGAAVECNAHDVCAEYLQAILSQGVASECEWACTLMVHDVFIPQSRFEEARVFIQGQGQMLSSEKKKVNPDLILIKLSQALLEVVSNATKDLPPAPVLPTVQVVAANTSAEEASSLALSSSQKQAAPRQDLWKSMKHLFVRPISNFVNRISQNLPSGSRGVLLLLAVFVALAAARRIHKAFFKKGKKGKHSKKN